MSHIWGSKSRWRAKYLEVTPKAANSRQLVDEDHSILSSNLAALRNLPAAIQTATLRAIHWREHGLSQRRPVDRFLAFWFALESLALAVYEHAPDLGISVDAGAEYTTKAQRKERKNELIRAIIDEELSSDPIRAAMRAYFEGVISLRRRCEGALRAMLGDADARIAWLYDPAPDAKSPSNLRSKIVHNALSAREVNAAFDVPETADKVVEREHVEVLTVEPQQLIGVEDRIRLGDAPEREGSEEFFPVEDLLIIPR